MRLVVVTLMWRRPLVTELVMRRWSRLRRSSEAEVILLAVGSEGEASQNIAERFDYYYIEEPNDPVADKYNAAFRAASVFQPDAVIRGESDDLVDRVLEVHERLIGEHEMVAFRDCYVLRSDGNEMRHVDNSYDGRPLGACQCLRRDLLERIYWSPFSGPTAALDLSSYRQTGAGRTVSMAESGACILDVKSETNIIGYETVGGTVIDPAPVLARFDEDDRAALEKIAACVRTANPFLTPPPVLL